MERGNYYVVMGFMSKDLKLRGNQRDIYAIIYGFTQSGGWYTGGIEYLKEWTVITSKTTVINALADLVEKGFIEKEYYEKGNVRLPKYRALYGVEGRFNFCTGVVQNLDGGGTKIVPDNKEYNINKNHNIYLQELSKLNLNDNLKKSIIAWLEYRDSKGKSYNLNAIDTIARRVINIAKRDGEEYAIEAIETAIAGGLLSINDYKDLERKRDRKRRFMEQRYKKKPTDQKHPWE